MVDMERMFPLVVHSRTRGRSSKLGNDRFKSEMRRNYFNQKDCESVEFSAVLAGTLNTFEQIEIFN